MNTNFSSLPLRGELLDNLASLNFSTMTPIQAQSLPLVLSGKDVIAKARTGSGKTAAFGLGILHNLDVKRFRIQAMVLCPTRELADQVAKELRKLARQIHNIKILTLCGGVPFGPQIGSLEHGAHILVGTPGRIEDHLVKGRIDLSELNTLVLDEADRMLEMGFQSAIDAVLDYAPQDRQTLLYSATFPREIDEMAAKVMRKPEKVEAEEQHDDRSISQHFYQVDSHAERIEALKTLLLKHQPRSCVVFCNTKAETVDIADALHFDGFSAIEINGDLEQRERDQTLVRFANKSVSVLVATDVAARGLDIDELDMVVNYQLSHDPEVHVHRVGRTGRAGNQGVACSLFTAKDAHKLIALEDYTNAQYEPETLPSVDADARPVKPSMVTLRIDGGKKQKVRAGDILGALTGKNGIQGKQVGKINLFDFCAYVAVEKSVSRAALNKLERGNLKGRKFRVWLCK
ncbi:ATP-dependent RNA helicase DbpA [Thaumasiovibrio subtropicus]|uniref:ATP-dependent RNA helicase DbpA n=1 Tax=Thaumasiovibrio subtropicus TaxID=1891207 RepID=UPI000B34B472|nr:ATP-dependent RNA helicase DbpA [Thaumasiovibrio subtropicus]